MRMNDDLISRQGVFDVLNGIKIPRNATWYQYYRQALDEVGCLPTISKVRTADDCISKTQAINAIRDYLVGKRCPDDGTLTCRLIENEVINKLPSVQPERKTGHWILDRSGAYCCDKCMEPCATYAMMKPRDKFCKMCGSRNEVQS